MVKAYVGVQVSLFFLGAGLLLGRLGRSGSLLSLLGILLALLQTLLHCKQSECVHLLPDNP